MTHTIFYQ